MFKIPTRDSILVDLKGAEEMVNSHLRSKGIEPRSGEAFSFYSALFLISLRGFGSDMSLLARNKEWRRLMHDLVDSAINLWGGTVQKEDN